MDALDLGELATVSGRRPVRGESEELQAELGLDGNGGGGGTVADAVGPPILRPRQQTRARRQILDGVVYGSSAFMSQIARHRWTARADPGYAGLASAWNQLVRRHGDKAQQPASSSAASSKAMWTHPNTYTAEGVVRAAFQELGGKTKLVAGEVGVQDSRHGLESLLSVAAPAPQ